ncbi:hypothetical protein DFH06DRAFT_1348443 [Mycena polygramma]|nr:hypothetical protein DFH06DRAFT_1348443 [Mycena polygramma]
MLPLAAKFCAETTYRRPASGISTLPFFQKFSAAGRHAASRAAMRRVQHTSAVVVVVSVPRRRRCAAPTSTLCLGFPRAGFSCRQTGAHTCNAASPTSGLDVRHDPRGVARRRRAAALTSRRCKYVATDALDVPRRSSNPKFDFCASRERRFSPAMLHLIHLGPSPRLQIQKNLPAAPRQSTAILPRALIYLARWILACGEMGRIFRAAGAGQPER